MNTNVSVVGYFTDFFLVGKILNKIILFSFLTTAIILGKRLFARANVLDWIKRHAFVLLFISVVLGLALRIAWVLWVPNAPAAEEGYLLDHAKGIAEGKGFVDGGKPTARRSVGYCLFLSLFYVFSHHPVMMAKLAQAGLSASISILLYPLGKAIKGPALGLLASFLWSVFPTAIFASSIIMDEHLCLPLLLLGLSFVIVHIEKPKLKYLVYSGICFGGAILNRPIPSLMPIVVFLCFWACKFTFWESLKKAACIGIMMLLCVTPWAIRNWIQLGSPIVYTDVQCAFYWANNSFYDVRYPVNPTAETGEDPEITNARFLTLQGPAQADAYSRLAVKAAWRWIWDNPSLFVKKSIGKACRMFGFSEEEWAINANFLTLEPGRSPPNAWVMKWLLIKSQNWAYVLLFLSAVGGFIIFLVQCLKGNINAPLLLVVLTAGQIFAITVLYLAHLKYRYMLDPFIILLSCYYFYYLPQLRRRNQV